MLGVTGEIFVRPAFKVGLGIAIIIGAVIFAILLYWLFNWLIFSYNFMTAVD